MLYVAVATRAFRRYSTYVGATLAGIFTNSVFGVIYTYAYLAIWQQRPDAGGYDALDAVTYVWLGQAMLMTVAIFGGGSTSELAERIRSGDIAVDLYRPVGLFPWFLAADLGRAAYHLLTRGVGPTILGWALFHIRLPTSPVAGLAFLTSVLLAVCVSFTIRFLVASASFWLLDVQGVNLAAMVLTIFFSGMALPLVIFPEPLRSIAFALPWSALVQTPADLWLGKVSGVDVWWALGAQAGWFVVLLGLCHLTLAAATRKVVVQGG